MKEGKKGTGIKEKRKGTKEGRKEQYLEDGLEERKRKECNREKFQTMKQGTIKSGNRNIPPHSYSIFKNVSKPGKYRTQLRPLVRNLKVARSCQVERKDYVVFKTFCMCQCER